MPRPTNKQALIELSNANYKRLIDFVDNLPAEELERDFPPGTLNRNVRDIYTHLHEWHIMLAEWYRIGSSGKRPDMPAKGYTWKTLPLLNKEIWEKYQNTSLTESKKLLASSFKKIQNIIASHNDEELFEKKRYPWTGSTSMGSYFVSATSSHYDWAYKMIKKAKR